MKRKLYYSGIILITSILLGFALTSCGISQNAEQEKNEENSSTSKEVKGVSGLSLIGYFRDEKDYSILSEIMYDPETMVMYVLVRDGNNGATASGFSMMYNADGTPRLYTPEK